MSKIMSSDYKSDVKDIAANRKYACSTLIKHYL